MGQSETIVSEIVDLFALIVPPGGGDELQVCHFTLKGPEARNSGTR